VIDIQFPYQVDMPIPETGFGNGVLEMHDFVRSRGFNHSGVAGARKRPPDTSTWCFDTLEAADAFAAEFGGTRVDVPKPKHWLDAMSEETRAKWRRGS
jgi:hypothetical protein